MHGDESVDLELFLSLTSFSPSSLASSTALSVVFGRVRVLVVTGDIDVGKEISCERRMSPA